MNIFIFLNNLLQISLSVRINMIFINMIISKTKYSLKKVKIYSDRAQEALYKYICIGYIPVNN